MLYFDLWKFMLARKLRLEFRDNLLDHSGNGTENQVSGCYNVVYTK